MWAQLKHVMHPDAVRLIIVLFLSFLILIGTMLLAEGFHQHIPKGYIYFAMAFAVGVEMLNVKVRARQAKPLALRQPYR